MNEQICEECGETFYFSEDSEQPEVCNQCWIREAYEDE